LKRRFPESTTIFGREELFCILLIRNAFPGRPPSWFDFQPHGSVSPATLVENSTVKSRGGFSVAALSKELFTKITRPEKVTIISLQSLINKLVKNFNIFALISWFYGCELLVIKVKNSLFPLGPRIADSTKPSLVNPNCSANRVILVTASK
jgi:hypothetical protein